MSQRQRASLPSSIEEVRDRIEHWRKARQKRSPMPEKLWDAAVSLARTHGIYAVAKALRVNYDTLRRRLAEAPKGGGNGAALSAGFVELDGAQIFGAAAATGALVEVSGADGAKLTIQLPGGENLDVLGLVASFWGLRS